MIIIESVLRRCAAARAGIEACTQTASVLSHGTSFTEELPIFRDALFISFIN